MAAEKGDMKDLLQALMVGRDDSILNDDRKNEGEF
jgi:hypothetical protein